MNGVQVIRWLLYADDLVLFCKNVEEVQKIMTILDNTCSLFCLTISFTKTKTQVFNNEELASLPSLFQLGKIRLKMCQNLYTWAKPSVIKNKTVSQI